MTPGPDDDPAAIVDGQITAINLVISCIKRDNHTYDIRSPLVVDGLRLLVVEGLRQLGAAESLLNEEQLARLHSGVVPAPDAHGFPLAVLEDLLGRLMIAEAGLAETDSGA
jgi:hypothetical protein